MTDRTQQTTTTKTTPTDGVLRRTVLKASAVTAGTLGLIGTATGDEHDDDEHGDHDHDDEAHEEAEDEENDDEESAVDEPDGFAVNILAEHSPFADDVAARFCVDYADNGDTPTEVVDLEDASSVIVAEATWTEGARSGWHRHPGMSIVTMTEGEIEHTMEGDCVPRTYAAGDAWIDPGHVHKADSDDGARAYVTFLGIPDGEPATEWVPPVEC
jgi:quercetin dioxygenase-like cupin family protein